jgi:hypothetical protein
MVTERQPTGGWATGWRFFEAIDAWKEKEVDEEKVIQVFGGAANRPADALVKFTNVGQVLQEENEHPKKRCFHGENTVKRRWFLLC